MQTYEIAILWQESTAMTFVVYLWDKPTGKKCKHELRLV